MTIYYRAIPHSDTARPKDAFSLAGGWVWFTHVEVLRRDAAPEIIPATKVPDDRLRILTAPRARIARTRFDRPQIMGILNVTPDSFSDGGEHNSPARALAFARQMAADGAAIIDVGGESTRPGAHEVPIEAEIARTSPVIRAIAHDIDLPISIDTRKAAVAKVALDDGATIVNDVAGFTFDPALAPLCAARGAPVCVMHAQGDPMTMQDSPTYDDVLLDIYDFLERQVDKLVDLGLSRDQIIVDPGLGFGKTIAHNLSILSRLSLFHSLGCPILLGASRKGMIRVIGSAPDADGRAPGSVAVALHAISQGVQIVRVHDVAATMQAIQLWQASTTGEFHGA